MAEGKGGAAEPWQVILKGKEQFDMLWGDYRMGGKNSRTEKEWSEAWAKAWAEADVRRGDRDQLLGLGGQRAVGEHLLAERVEGLMDRRSELTAAVTDLAGALIPAAAA